jgi:hypothetical protein
MQSQCFAFCFWGFGFIGRHKNTQPFFLIQWRSCKDLKVFLDVTVELMADQGANQSFRWDGADKLKMLGTIVVAFEKIGWHGDVDKRARKQRTVRYYVYLQLLCHI